MNRIHNGAHVYSHIYNQNHKPDIPSHTHIYIYILGSLVCDFIYIYIYRAWNNQKFPQNERRNMCITVTTIYMYVYGTATQRIESTIYGHICMQMEAFTFMKIEMTNASTKVTRYHYEGQHKKHTLEEYAVVLILLNVAFLSARMPPPMFMAQVEGLAPLCMFG
jgi:hypothetical protein